jgi:uncharacterized membrane protein
MLLSSIPDIIVTPGIIRFMAHLGYPKYFIPFIGIAKLSGVIAILIPGYPKIKEWAYAGLFFDLIGATYSQISVEGFQPDALFMLLPLTLLFFSLFLYSKNTPLYYTNS